MNTSNRPELPKILFFTLLGALISAINGSVVALVSASHSWGIVSLVALLAIAYWIVQSAKIILRATKIDNSGLGIKMTFVMMLFYVFAETQVSALFMGTSLTGFFSLRWHDGMPLFGAGSWAMGGWLWLVVYVIKMLFLLLLFFAAAADEGDRPFCEDCGSATTNLVWKQPVGRFDLGLLKAFARQNGQWDIESLMTDPEPDPSGDGAVLITIWTCDCTARYEFRAEVYEISSKIGSSEIVGFLPMTAMGVSRVVEWVWSIDPEAHIPEKVLDIYKQNPLPDDDIAPY